MRPPSRSFSPSRTRCCSPTLRPPLPAQLRTHSPTKRVLWTQSCFLLPGVGIVYLVVGDTPKSSKFNSLCLQTSLPFFGCTPGMYDSLGRIKLIPQQVQCKIVNWLRHQGMPKLYLFIYLFLSFVFLGLHPWHMEVPG